MKCENCGEELKDGSLFCSQCGKAVQIVPEYNVYDEDYLKQMIKEENREGKNGQRKDSASGKKQTAGIRERKQVFILLGLAAAFVIAVVGLVIVGIYKVKSTESGTFMYQIQMAEEAYNNGDIDSAISYYEHALWLEKDNTKLRMILAGIYKERKDYDSVILYCREVIQLDRSNREACEMLIDIYDQQKDYDEILSLYENVDKSLARLFSAYLVTPPVFSRESGTYRQFMKIELATGKNFTIYYCTDGADPTLYGQKYTGPIELDRNLHTYKISAACVNEKGIFSEVVMREYAIDLPAPSMPVVTPDGGMFSEETLVTITVPDGCSAYYTWDSTDPNIESELYIEPLVVPEGNNVLSVLIVDNATELVSDIFRGNYVYYPDAEFTDDPNEDNPPAEPNENDTPAEPEDGGQGDE